MIHSPRRRSRAQSLVEFTLTVALLMVLVVATVQVAIFLHYRSSLQLAAQEGAFEGSLAGHGPADATNTADALWAKLEPSGGPAQVSASVQGNLVVVQAHAVAPAILPVPVPPFTSMPVNVRSVHTIERFQAGSAP
jgi:Flp pilus assembly protein TadG